MQNGRMVIKEDEKEVERLQTVLEHWATIGTSGFASWSRGRGGEKGRTWPGCLANKHCHWQEETSRGSLKKKNEMHKGASC